MPQSLRGRTGRSTKGRTLNAMELCIDTSTRYAAVGLSNKGETIAELSWRSERNHSVELVPSIRTLMRHAGVKMGEVEAVFVAGGPGAFSALRVGMSTAKALASGAGVPLVSVGTLELEAQPYMGFGIPLHALIEAGRDRLYVGRYGLPPDAPVFGVMSHDELVSSIESRSLFCGEAARSIAGTLTEALGGRAVVADFPPPTRRASVLARLGYRRWEAGAIDDPAVLQPMYLRSARVDTAHRTWART